MSRIADIRLKFNVICDQNTSVFGFAFDDPSKLNLIRGDGFPYLLLKLPIRSSIPDYKQDWELWDIEFYLFEPRHQEEARTLEDQHDALRVIAEDVIDELVFYPNVYQLGSGVEFEYGHDGDNNNSVVVKTKFTLRLFNCRGNTATGEVVTITDNDNALVGTVAARTSLQVIARDTDGVEIDATYTLSNGILILSVITTGGINMETFTGVTTSLTNAAFANKLITSFVVLISGTDWVTQGNATKTYASTTINLVDTEGNPISAEGATATVLYI